MTKRFKIIMREWNLWLVPYEVKTDGGRHAYFPEKYYIMPDLLELWGHKHGYGFKEIDADNLIKGVDFDTKKMDTVRHVKIARGAPTVHMKDEPVAVLTSKGRKALTQRRRRRTIQQKKMVKEFSEQIKSGENINIGEHSRIVRNALKKQFPDIKFRVKSIPSKYGGSIFVYHSRLQTNSTFHPRRKEIEEFINKFNGKREDLKEERYNVGFVHNGKRLIGAQFIAYNGSDIEYLTNSQIEEIAKKEFEND
jgi:hypothetical protein